MFALGPRTANLAFLRIAAISACCLGNPSVGFTIDYGAQDRHISANVFHPWIGE
jgi:hypothetical protein